MPSAPWSAARAAASTGCSSLRSTTSRGRGNMKSIAVLALALAMTGCASFSGSVAQGRGLTDEDISKLKVGVSRTVDVRDLMGPPHRVETFRRLEREVWTYKMYSGIVRELMVIDDPQSQG